MSQTHETAEGAVAAAVAEPRAEARAARIAAWVTADRAALRDALVSALLDPRAEVRRRVILICSDALPADEALGDSLLVALADPVWSVREAAVVAAGQFPDLGGNIHALLVGLTLHDPCPLVRRAAAATTGARIEPDRDYATAIRHTFERQRIRAADALGFTARERAVAAVGLLSGAAADPHPKVRTAALRALARLEPVATLPLIPVVVRRCVEAEAGVADAARALWARLLADPVTEVFHPLRAFAETEAANTVAAIERLPELHPLRAAWDSLSLPAKPLDAHRFARHLARVCEAVLARAT